MDWFSALCQPTSSHVEGSGNARDRNAGPAAESDNWMKWCAPSSQNGMHNSHNGGRGNAQPERAGIGIILALAPDGSLFVHTVFSRQHPSFPVLGEAPSRRGRASHFLSRPWGGSLAREPLPVVWRLQPVRGAAADRAWGLGQVCPGSSSEGILEPGDVLMKIGGTSRRNPCR